MRLFLALNPPTSIQQALWDDTGALRDGDLPVRWVRVDALHVTLKFLGDVGDAQEPAITAALDRAVSRTKSIAVAFDGFGAFPSVARPRVIWAGLDRVPALELRQHDIEGAMEPLGFEREMRVFHPHITLGRVKRDAPLSAFTSLGDALDRIQFEESFVAERVDLMQSTLSPKGSRYSVRHAADLGGGA